jgi:TM2 domain-containing membrane protein YozV
LLSTVDLLTRNEIRSAVRVHASALSIIPEVGQFYYGRILAGIMRLIITPGL